MGPYIGRDPGYISIASQLMCVALAAVQLGRKALASPFPDNLLEETRLTHLSLGDDHEVMPTGYGKVELADFSRLAALRHLGATAWWQLSPDDCRAVAQLQHLTTLELPEAGSGEVSPLPMHLVSTCRNACCQSGFGTHRPLIWMSCEAVECHPHPTGRQ